MFGADSLKRKYGTTPPAEWESVLADLSDAQLRHGLNELLRGGVEHIPSLPQFMGMCRNCREWTAPIRNPQIEDNRFDKWDMAANNHLLGYVLKAGGMKRYFDAEQTAVLVKWKNAWARDCRDEEDDGLGVDVEKQKLWWSDCMERAERDMSGIAALAASKLMEAK